MSVSELAKKIADALRTSGNLSTSVEDSRDSAERVIREVIQREIDPNPNHVVLDEAEIFWEVNVVPCEDPDDGKFAELRFGWTAFGSPDNIAEDAPSGYGKVKVLPESAEALRDRLDQWLKEVRHA